MTDLALRALSQSDNNVIMSVLHFLSLLPCFPIDIHSLEVEAEKDTYFLTCESRWTEW